MMTFRKTRKLSHGKEVFRWGTFTLIYLGDMRFHFSYIHNNSVKYGSINLTQNRFQVIPLLFFATVITAFLGFSPIQGPTLTQAQVISEFTEPVEVSENDVEDTKAKQADESYLQDTEAQKLSILNSEEELEEIDKLTRYTLKEGETVESVAKKYSIDLQELRSLSGLNPDDDLKPGKYIYLPGKNGLVHTFQKGDTLAKLVSNYNITLDDVLFENKLKSADFFTEGEKIFLPGAYIPPPQPVWYMPVASKLITSDFGWRSYPRSHFHDALDLKANYEPVKAARTGTVIYSGWMGGYGNVVILQHSQGLKTLYAHNSKLMVKRGDKVSGGKVISRSGCTGYCFGAHLHFEVIKNGKPVDPKKYIKGFAHKNE
jgi:murein DD-endopeptidase MepM/ murein hydrolase activator NlpD